MKIEQGMPVIVTGGASGLGASTAQIFAQAGAKVTVFDRSQDAGEKIARAIEGHFVKVDVANEESVLRGFAEARGKFGQERVLVNCAGIAPAEKTLSSKGRHTDAGFRNVIDVNLIGTFLCTTVSVEGMSTLAIADDGERGCVVNTASIAAFEGQSGQIAYAASKAAVVGMTLPLARDLARYSIRVCSVAPGLFETPMVGSMPDQVRDSLYGQVPFPSRAGTGKEFAQLVKSIVENGYLNGETIRLDAAMRMAAR